MGADVKTWTIGPDGISADGEENTNNAFQFAQALPEVIQLGFGSYVRHLRRLGAK